MNTQQGKQQKQHDKSHGKLCELYPHDSVSVRNFRGGGGKWVPGTVIRRLGPLVYLVRVGRQLRYVHIDHLLKTKCVNTEVCSEEIPVPELPSPTSDATERPATNPVPLHDPVPVHDPVLVHDPVPGQETGSVPDPGSAQSPQAQTVS